MRGGGSKNEPIHLGMGEEILNPPQKETDQFSATHFFILEDSIHTLFSLFYLRLHAVSGVYLQAILKSWEIESFNLNFFETLSINGRTITSMAGSQSIKNKRGSKLYLLWYRTPNSSPWQIFINVH